MRVLDAVTRKKNGRRTTHTERLKNESCVDVGLVCLTRKREEYNIWPAYFGGRRHDVEKKKKKDGDTCQVHWSLHHSAACDWRYSSMRAGKSAYWGQSRQYCVEFGQSWTGSSAASRGRADNRYKLRCSEVIRRWLRRVLRSLWAPAGGRREIQMARVAQKQLSSPVFRDDILVLSGSSFLELRKQDSSKLAWWTM